MKILEYRGDLVSNVNSELRCNEKGLQLHQNVKFASCSFPTPIRCTAVMAAVLKNYGVSAEDVSQLLPLSNLSSVTRNALPIRRRSLIPITLHPPSRV